MKIANWMQQGLPQAETVIFENFSHFFLMEEPGKALATLDGWFKKHG